ncbi:MAG: FAD-dependent oxidoreductase [bacterium]|nr:FAD-dependent oxidoreductase [bacterium]
MQGVGVAVIGAGLAGLRAASSLSRAGFAVTVLERGCEVGGRAAGGWVGDYSVDRVMPLMRSSDRALLSWVDELELADVMLPPRAVILSQIHRGSVEAITTSELSDLARIPGVKLWDKKRLLRFPRLMNRYRALLDPVYPERAADLDFRSARDFATLYFGKSLWNYWISPETTSEYAADEMELSRVAFLLSRIASDNGQARLGVLRRGLWELAEHAASRLDVQREVVADEILARPAGGYVIRCSSAADGQAQRPEPSPRSLEFDAVVIATSPETAGRIAAPVLVPAERDYFADYRSGPSASLVFALDSPLEYFTKFVRVPKAEASPIECYLTENGTAQGRVPAGKGLVTLRANDRFARANISASDDVVEKSLLAAFSRFYPEMAGQPLFTRLQRSRNANPNFHVRAYRDLARFARVQEDRGNAGRRVYFAGNYLVGPGPNEAIASGQRVAAALRAHFKG